MTSFNIILPNKNSIDIPWAEAQESQLIKDFIRDTGASVISLSHNVNLTESDIKLFYQKYDEFKNWQKYHKYGQYDLLLIGYLLKGIEVADYFQYNFIDSLLLTLIDILQFNQCCIKKDLNSIKDKLTKTMKYILREAIYHSLIVVPIVYKRRFEPRNEFEEENKIEVDESDLPPVIKDMFSLINRSGLGTVETGVSKCPKVSPIMSKIMKNLAEDWQVECDESDFSGLNLELVSDNGYPHHSSTSRTIPTNNNFVHNLSNCQWLSLDIREYTSNGKAYYKNNVCHNKIFINGLDIKIHMYGSSPTRDIILKYNFLTMSATKYNNYIFGTINNTPPFDMESMVPFNFDQDSAELYSKYSHFHDVIIVDTTTNKSIFRLTLPKDQYYFVDDSGHYLVTFYKLANIIELYDIDDRMRILKKDLSETIGIQEYDLNPILNIFFKLIYIETSPGRYLILDFKGNILNYPDKSQIIGKHYCLPMKSGLLVLTDPGNGGNHLYLYHPKTLEIKKLILEDDSVITGPFCYKIAVSPNGEHFCFYGKYVYKGKLFPSSQEDYSYIESLLKNINN